MHKMLLEPPPNYVAGLGRGATSFTTRSDIGPAHAVPIGAEEEKGNDDNNKFDVFKGNDKGLFANVDYDEDDKEADIIWDAIDEIMDSKRKDRRERRLKDEIKKYRADNLKITEQFADLKRNLETISNEEWDSIPDIGDYSFRNKKKRFESFVPIPDTLLEQARREKQLVSASDLTAVGEGRSTVLSLNLDRVSDSVSGLTSIDQRGYLTDLNSMRTNSDVVISYTEESRMDLEKLRMIHKLYVNTNPKEPKGWIAAARVEEKAGKIGEARRLLERGIEECPKSEDLWMEVCRIANLKDAKGVIARGVNACPYSVNLWIEASKLEKDDTDKSRVLRKGLENVPDSVRLWKAVVELANEEDAKVLLYRAVECCPLSLDLWLALVRLENYSNARRILKRAKERFPKERAIWITAAKLEEAKGNIDTVARVIERGIRVLERDGVGVDREGWIKEAEGAERAGFIATCKGIIGNIIGVGVEDEDRKRTWVGDAEECEKRSSIDTARAIYGHALRVFMTKKSVWIKAVQFEKRHGTNESLDGLLHKAVTYMPRVEVLWLIGAKEKWLSGDVASARTILQEAYAAIPDSEEIWLAAFKLEFENREVERARMILKRARERGGTERVWMKSAIVERELGNVSEERKLLDEGVRKFSSFFKMWLMLGQLEERIGNVKQAKGVYESGLKNCPNCVPLWLSLCDLEEKMNGLSKARAVLTMSRKKIPKSPDLWLAAILAESRHGNKKEADILMSKALQECPKSGILWAAYIDMLPRQRKSKSGEAFKKCNNDPFVMAVIGKLFWNDRKIEKARDWFNRVVSVAPDIGDFWALYYKFELRHGTYENQTDVLKRCVAAEPKHGKTWQVISKDVANSHMGTEAILKKVVIALGDEENGFEK